MRRGGLVAALLLLAVAWPAVEAYLVPGGWSVLDAVKSIFIFAILGLALNAVTGFTGILNLGIAAFMAIGAYAFAILTADLYPFQLGFWPAILLTLPIGAFAGFLLGAPTLGLRGDYLAIVTLGFGEIVPAVFLNAEPVTGGTKGLNPIAKPPAIGPITFGQTDQRNWYYLMLAVVLLSLFLITRLHDSRIGRSWMAVREDEIAASSMGVNLVRTKLWAFALGASFSGFAGSIYSSAFQYVHPSQFEFSVSIMILASVILGGIGNVYGVIVGAILIGSFDRILAEVLTGPLNRFGELIGSEFLANHALSNDRYLVFGLALVLMMLLRPGGLFPDQQRKAELTPDDADITMAENQQMYDVRQENEPALGERA